MAKKFNFKKDEIVNFSVDGEKHMGTVVSGGIYSNETQTFFHLYYCVSDLNDNSMWEISENELEKSSVQEISDRLVKAFSDSIFAGYNPFGGDNGKG